MFSILVLPSPQLATNAPLPPSHIQQPVPRLLNNIREHCRVCNLPYDPNKGLTSSNQHTQWCHHFCPHLGTSCGALLVLQVAPRPELLVTYPWTASRAQAAATSSSEPETCELHANLQFEEDICMYIYIYTYIYFYFSSKAVSQKCRVRSCMCQQAWIKLVHICAQGICTPGCNWKVGARPSSPLSEQTCVRNLSRIVSDLQPQ